MKKHSICSRIASHYSDLCLFSRTLDKRFVEEDVHDFRVKVKKLRALLRLAAQSKKSHLPVRLPHRLRNLYALTGVVRTLQLQRKALTAFAEKKNCLLPAGISGVFDQRIQSASNKAQQYLGMEHPFDERIEGLSRLPDKIEGAATKKFIRRKMKSFRTVPMPPLSFTTLQDEAVLHDFRKSLKDLLYAWPYLEKTARQHFRPSGLRSKKDIALLAALLGEFRDCCLCMALFQDEDFLFYSGQPAKAFLQAAAESFLSEKKALLLRINKALLFALKHRHIPASCAPEIDVPIKHKHARPISGASVSPQVAATHRRHRMHVIAIV